MSDNLDLNPDAIYKEKIADLREVDGKDYDPTQDLLYTRGARGQIIKAIAGKGLSQDPKELQLLLSVLKDMDSSALGQMRIKSDEKGQDLQSQHQAMVRAFLSEASGFTAPLRKAGDEASAPPSLGDDVATRDFVPGELTQGTINSTFEEFVARTGELTLAATDVED